VNAMADEEIKQAVPEAEHTDDGQEHGGGGRFNRLGLMTIAGIVVIAAVVGVHGIHSAGSTTPKASQGLEGADDGSAERHKTEVSELAAGSATPLAMPTPGAIAVIPLPKAQTPVERLAKTPSRYAQWAEDKYMRALEAPQMVGAFHSAGTLELGGVRGGQDGSRDATIPDAGNPNVTLRPPASPYMVMAGSVVPAVLVSGIDSDLPGPILAQVSENVFDSATGQRLLIPQGSRLIGAYESAASYGQQRVQIAWQRIIFPNTSSMELPQMPGADQSGAAGFTDQVNNHYLATFGTAALTSLISAGQMVGQMAAFGGGGTYGPYGYYQPNQWAMAGETAGSAASGQFGNVGQQMMGQGMRRPPTLEIRPGYQFNVMVTEDLAFPGPYKG
jgi:type IV secretory pathway VirB10-like protein